MFNRKIGVVVISMLILLALLVASFFYLLSQGRSFKGSYKNVRIFTIEAGDGSALIAKKMKKDGLIWSELYFRYYMKNRGLSGKIIAGNYELSGELTIPEIAIYITQEQNKNLKITFPEGWDSKKMAERLSSNGFSGDEFLEIAKNPPFELTNKYSFFSMLPKGVSLEGYLFPDTYFFSQKLKTEDVAKKIIANFDNQLTADLREEIKKQGKTLPDIITMASIIEKEVKSDEDRKMISGIFWNRIKNGQPLQSCATIAYILGTSKEQYSFEDTRIESPYNTYLNAGLPPGPISNPGILSIKAAIYPEETNYNYFLSDPKTGKTVFSRTIEEHNANKYKAGL